MMKIKLLVCIIALAFLVSCASIAMVETEIIRSDGKTIIIKSKSDARVLYEAKDDKAEVDNRGKPSFLETIFSGWVLKGDRRK
ncbi:hypothetical protein LCGC14_1245300 [marine sediment metagenome]|uniref:Uncharacterized protein n=1 Tax=marine sediment metagenome TaxID=412755 RepID=A0A0F9P8R8_9ZZZZ